MGQTNSLDLPEPGSGSASATAPSRSRWWLWVLALGVIALGGWYYRRREEFQPGSRPVPSPMK